MPTKITNFPSHFKKTGLHSSSSPPPIPLSCSFLKHYFLLVSALLTKPHFPITIKSQMPLCGQDPPYTDLSHFTPRLPPLSSPQASQAFLLSQLCSSFAGCLGAALLSAQVPSQHHFPTFSSPQCLLTSCISRNCHPCHTN